MEVIVHYHDDNPYIIPHHEFVEIDNYKALRAENANILANIVLEAFLRHENKDKTERLQGSYSVLFPVAFVPNNASPLFVFYQSKRAESVYITRNLIRKGVIKTVFSDAQYVTYIDTADTENPSGKPVDMDTAERQRGRFFCVKKENVYFAYVEVFRFKTSIEVLDVDYYIKNDNQKES